MQDRSFKRKTSIYLEMEEQERVGGRGLKGAGGNWERMDRNTSDCGDNFTYAHIH